MRTRPNLKIGENYQVQVYPTQPIRKAKYAGHLEVSQMEAFVILGGIEDQQILLLRDENMNIGNRIVSYHSNPSEHNSPIKDIAALPESVGSELMQVTLEFLISEGVLT